MSENAPPSPASEELHEVVVHRGRGVSLVWLVPVIAVLIGAYLGWDAYQNRGVQIVIHFPTAEWVQAGKTKIRFREVEVGSVDEVKLSEGREGVEFHCTMVREALPHLTEGAQFWIVHPRVGGGEISGLGTLLSGAYLSFAFGPEGAPRARSFVGLLDPPIAPTGEGGIRVVLHAPALHSINIGTGVYYRGKKVAEVEHFDLDDDGEGVAISLYFERGPAKLVRQDSRFWNVGGVDITTDMGQLNINAESLSTMLVGGIAFDAPSGAKGAPAKSGASFWLHSSRPEVDSHALRYGGMRITVEASHLGGVGAGDAVTYRETPVGAVVSSALSPDSRRLRVLLNIHPRYAHLVRTNSVFWNASGFSADLGLTGLHVHAESLQALLAGGIAFATPDSPGPRAKAGSVFALQPEVKGKWLEWDPVLRRSSAPATPSAQKDGEAAAADEEHEPGPFERFFHHEDKPEEAVQEEDATHVPPTHEAALDRKRHRLLSNRHH